MKRLCLPDDPGSWCSCHDNDDKSDENVKFSIRKVMRGSKNVKCEVFYQKNYQGKYPVDGFPEGFLPLTS